MRRYRQNIILVLIAASIIRIWNLGSVPAGLSLPEANFGLFFTKYLGSWVLNPFIIRLPFAVLGIFSVYLSYKLVKKVTNDEKLSLLLALILTVLPWHIEQSRIVGPGMFLFVILLVFSTKLVVMSTKLIKKKLFILSCILGIILAFSLFRTSKAVADKVNTERNIAFQSDFFASRVFLNKVVENYRLDEKLIFENLDWGNYFFKGHPRERWGTEEVQKLFIIFIPFFLIGAFCLTGKMRFLVYFWLLFGFIVIFLFRTDAPGLTFPLAFPLTLLTAIGVNETLKRKGKTAKVFINLSVILFVFELLTFTRAYYWNLGESLFSLRRPVYENLVESVYQNKDEGEKVMVSTRLRDPEPFFRFYLGSNYNNSDYTFSNFDIFKVENKDLLFIDVLPYEASPAEPLYGKDGDLPPQLELISEFKDDMLKQTVFVYRYK